MAGTLLAAACTHDAPGPEPAGIAGYGLHYNDQGDIASLAYGRPHSDDMALMLQCEKGSGQVQVSDAIRREPGRRLVLASEGRKAELPIRVEQGVGAGPMIATAEAPAEGPVMSAFRRSGRIAVSLGEVSYLVQASPEERQGVDTFFADCAAGASAPRPQGGGEGGPA